MTEAMPEENMLKAVGNDDRSALSMKIDFDEDCEYSNGVTEGVFLSRHL